MKKIKKKIQRFIRWYILGYYHCDKCPYCWEEWNFEGDGDCGCYIKGDIQDSCRLLPPFRFLFGYFKKRNRSIISITNMTVLLNATKNMINKSTV